MSPKQILELFFHRKDVFALQQKNGAYFPEKRIITEEDIEKHLFGEITLGAYCLNTDNTVKWACIDIDGTPEEVKTLRQEAETIYSLFPEFPRILEFSGNKGFHIWIFFNPIVQAAYAQFLVRARLNRVGLNHHEVFPKQTELNESRLYGNLVKIPLALHKKSGKRSEIIKMEGVII